ncbi:pyocin knob domain-containing protein [Mesorhizobium sp. Pch-S]|uniref:pyocin knob domain-containing protein n=1 Tax=Mesorhizobium sp. Pch-S TaxID=2082387 RepID=UPI0010100B72|nr:pyocin knob domain-containing protein [Mesorhizobium sp. Pch-S]QAZ46154.1 hypothetical protein C1M53_27720 [Mesorhizobium sp. Pch-S]
MGITYYDTGAATLSVGSKTMTGQGTLWAGWVKPGDQVMPEEGTNNVVDVVVSNTEITLLKPYHGVAQAARPYTIMRTPDVVFTESLARKVLQDISSSPLVALAGLPAVSRSLIGFGPTQVAETVPLSDKVKAFLATIPSDDVVSLLAAANFASIRNSLNVAPKQSAIDDATAGAGLTVGAFGLGGVIGLSIPLNDYNKALRSGIYAGSGASAVNGPPNGAAYGPMLVMARASTVVTQMAGFGDTVGSAFTLYLRHTGDGGATWTPWRPIVPEKGANSSGFYSRFADGTQICWMQDLTFGPITTAAGSIYSGAAEQTFSFPAAFASAGQIDCLVMSDSTNIWGACSVPSNTAVRAQLFCYASIASSRKANILAHGRWF